MTGGRLDIQEGSTFSLSSTVFSAHGFIEDRLEAEALLLAPVLDRIFVLVAIEAWRVVGLKLRLGSNVVFYQKGRIGWMITNPMGAHKIYLNDRRVHSIADVSEDGTAGSKDGSKVPLALNIAGVLITSLVVQSLQWNKEKEKIDVIITHIIKMIGYRFSGSKHGPNQCSVGLNRIVVGCEIAASREKLNCAF